MNVWLIKTGEPLPIDGANYRPHRIGMLADALLERGHDVTWWTSTLNHQSKRQRFDKDTVVTVGERYRVNLLHSMAYKSNVSVRRLLDHAQLGRRFTHAIHSAPKPDLIFCCYPTIELALASVRYGRSHNVPVLIDVRDLWPDNFLSVIPERLRGLAGLGMRIYSGSARRAFSQSTGIVGISESYLQFGLDYAGRMRTDRDGLFPLGYQRPEIDESSLAEARAGLLDMGVNPSQTICWFVGMFGRTYDLDTVIDSARKLANRGIDDVQFVLSGTGETETALRAKAAGLRNVLFTGRINTTQVAAMSKLANIGLMAYTEGAPQGLPNKLYEYMSAGLPIVSSLEGETEEMLAKFRCGLTYGANDAVSLSEVIETLRIDPELCRMMGDQGRKAFDERFSAETVYVQLAEYLERTAGHMRPSESVAGLPSIDSLRELAA